MGVIEILWSFLGVIGVLVLIRSAGALGCIQFYAKEQGELLREILDNLKNKKTPRL